MGTPIPYSKVSAEAQRFRLSQALTNLFVSVIYKLDDEHGRWSAEQQKKQQAVNAAQDRRTQRMARRGGRG